LRSIALTFAIIQELQLQVEEEQRRREEFRENYLVSDQKLSMGTSKGRVLGGAIA